MKRKVVTFSVNENTYRKFSSIVKSKGRNYSEVISEEIENLLKDKRILPRAVNESNDGLKAVHIPEGIWERYSIFLIKEGETKSNQIRGIIREYVWRDENVVSGKDATN